MDYVTAQGVAQEWSRAAKRAGASVDGRTEEAQTDALTASLRAVVPDDVAAAVLPPPEGHKGGIEAVLPPGRRLARQDDERLGSTRAARSCLSRRTVTLVSATGRFYSGASFTSGTVRRATDWELISEHLTLSFESRVTHDRSSAVELFAAALAQLLGWPPEAPPEP